MNRKKKGNDVGIKVVQPDSATQWDPMTTCLQTMCCTCELCLRVFCLFRFPGLRSGFWTFGERVFERVFLRIAIKYTVFVATCPQVRGKVVDSCNVKIYFI